MKVVFATSEAAPWCRSGGLGDVAGSLPDALVDAGADVTTFLPLHRKARKAIGERGAEVIDLELNVAVPLAGGSVTGRLFEVAGTKARTILVDAPGFFDRDSLYGYGDDALRYGFFSRAVLVGAQALLGEPDIVHAHDWMTALVPTYLEARMKHRLPRTRSVFTIHNLAYQGIFGKDQLQALDLDWGLFNMDMLEFFDAINLMKCAITASDAVTTVSPTYAQEITTPAFGHQLDGHLRTHRGKLRGIVNGLDLDDWNPATDPALPAPFSAAELAGKAACRQALLKRFQLSARDDQPVVAVLSRFTAQKGLDLVCDVVPPLVRNGARVVVLGTGERSIEDRFRMLGAVFPQQVGVKIAFDDKLARLLIAGSDLFLMPSRFEPCGLAQLQAMRYGTVPVVHATGGLKDTVDDPGDAGLLAGRGTGFSFRNPTSDGLWWAVDRAVNLWRHKKQEWAALQQRAMARDSGWGTSAAEYVALYERLLAR